MKAFLNTLYVTTQGAYLCKDGLNIVVQVDHQERLRLPLHTIAGIVCLGQVTCTPDVMHFCAENNVAISFLTEHGRFLASVRGPISGNVLLRRAQYRRADDDLCSAQIASAILTAKFSNCRTVLQRALRDHPQLSSLQPLSTAILTLEHLLRSLDPRLSLDELRGIEGQAAAAYFGVLDHLILTNKDHFFFRARSRRPPLDNLNCMLSFLYTLLMHDLRSALEVVGLDPQVGYLHRDRPGRYGLALDLMEELRPILADRLALSLINLHQVHPDGFLTHETGAVSMNDQTRKQLIVAYQNRKRETLRHPFLNEEVELGLVPLIQAQLLARHLRGDLDAYPAFIWK
ncbi:MAG: type I-C CRISPR-associated endonuclease Cas1c [bacterium]|nr:type I-C CRISPR-associated endonuclease Cas1c [bacterium]